MWNKNKRSIFIAVVLVIIGLTLTLWNSGILAATGSGTGKTVTVQTAQTFTKDQLAKYNGQNGNPAYIAVNGVVYDVTNVPAWKNGKHKGYTAGVDLTEAIKNAPHGTAVLNGLPVIGKYIGK